MKLIESEKEWRRLAIKILKREMGYALVSSQDLSKKLGVQYPTFITRIHRGNFSAGFFLQALHALNVSSIDLIKLDFDSSSADNEPTSNSD